MLEATYRVRDSAVLDAPIDEVWPIVRDIVRLVPLVFGEGFEACHWVEGCSAEQVPARYEVKSRSSGTSVLEVVGRSETEYFVTYRLVGQALGITGYIATYQLRPITTEPDRTFLDWARQFAVAPGNDPAKVVPAMASSTAKEALALKKHFSKRSTPAPR
ncbi:SRPBCC family protein [Hyalangium gracile]|uniref:SRPBCC family protein n=1 Tax=Hyalangium gracile TaxID=394092 RepID=UPI001CCD505B|nr:SRPBCC family protein [Hyalangium gracile]